MKCSSEWQRPAATLRTRSSRPLGWSISVSSTVHFVSSLLHSIAALLFTATPRLRRHRPTESTCAGPGGRRSEVTLRAAVARSHTGPVDERHRRPDAVVLGAPGAVLAHRDRRDP